MKNKLSKIEMFGMLGIGLMTVCLYVSVTTPAEQSEHGNAASTDDSRTGNRHGVGVIGSKKSTGATRAGSQNGQPNAGGGVEMPAANNLGVGNGSGKKGSGGLGPSEAKPSRVSPGAAVGPPARTHWVTPEERARQRLEPYFDRTGFTEEERIRTVEILTDTNAAFGAIATTARQENLAPREIAARSTGALTETESKLADLLGADRASEVMALKKTSYLRQTVVEELAGRCAANGVPISAKTADDLGVLLGQAGVSPPPPPPPYGYTLTPDQYWLRTLRDPVGIAAAQKILTPQQIELLKNSLAARFTVKK